MLQQLKKANLQVNMKKSCFANTEIKYLGYMVTTKGIRPLANKVEAIQRLQPPKTLRQLRAFLGMVNYYRDMWRRRSHIIAPLTELTKGAVSSQKAKTTKINWTPHCTELFNKIKKALTKEMLLAFPDFKKKFEVHTNASKYQLGGVISQEGTNCILQQKIECRTEELHGRQKGNVINCGIIEGILPNPTWAQNQHPY